MKARTFFKGGRWKASVEPLLISSHGGATTRTVGAGRGAAAIFL